mmetsp:Transcript_20/g.22  ORF Transcript_20/g.22 Transcript_20/m.22 type:complete len:252 (+) Transcript_20:207-962(+)
MIVLLSPAKSMCVYRATQFAATCPSLLDHSDIILNVMKGKTAKDLKDMMNISANIASLNYDRYQSFINNESGETEKAITEGTFSPSASSDLSTFKMTSLVFDGPAYKGFDASTLSPQEFLFAQQHVRILSGLYGILRPSDLIQEYRLEMGTKLDIGSHKSLYQFWGDTITDNILAELDAQLEGKGEEETDKKSKTKKTKATTKESISSSRTEGVYINIDRCLERLRLYMFMYKCLCIHVYMHIYVHIYVCV